MKKLLQFLLLFIPLFSAAQTYEDFFSAGTVNFNLKDYIAAIADYNSAIALCPNFVFNFYGKGLAKIELKNIVTDF